MRITRRYITVSLVGWLRRWLEREPHPELFEQASLFDALADTYECIDPWDLPTVVAGRALIADTCATFPMVAVRGGDRITPTPNVLTRPDPRETYGTTIERTVNALTRHGIAWYRIYARDAAGYPAGVRLIDNGRVTYRLSQTADEIAQVWVDGVDTPRATLLVIPFRCDPGPVGRSPLVDIAQSLENLAGALRFAADYYARDAAVPPYAIKHPTRLTGTQADDYMTQWLTARIARRPALLSGGIELETFTPTSAADALLIDAVRELDATIARVLLIPPSLMNVLSQGSLTYATTADEFRRWLTTCLYPGYLRRIGEGFSTLLPRGQTAVFDTSNLTRMDWAGRIDTYAAGLGAGIYTLPEVRALEGLPVTPAAQPVPIEPNVEGL